MKHPKKPILIYLYILCVVALCGCQEIIASPQNNDVELFLNSYFSSWSQNDMTAYRDHFHDQTVITKLEKGKVAWSLHLDKFIERQANFLNSTKGPVSERMTSFSIKEDSQSIAAYTEWIFEGEGQTTTGVDHFILMRLPNRNLKIISLVWYKN